jgi:hypothetical protein
MTITEVKRQLKGIPKEKHAAVVCALIGHSRIHTSCFGYKYCSRCDAQVGDSLGGVYSGENTVIVGHNCDTCRENYKKMDWRDKFMAPDPFKEEEVAQ